MREITQSIELDVPVNAAYRQWSQFEEFPRFMDGVVAIERLGDDRLLWHASICGNDVAWYARVTEDVPCEKIAWRSDDGLLNVGSVSLHALGKSRTRVDLRLEFEPEAVLNAIGYKLVAGGTEQARHDLECFKEIVEDMAEEAATASR